VGTGLAAIFTTVFIMKQPLKNLRFNRFSPGGNSISAEMIIAAQVLLAFTLAPFINILFALGEELSWRGFLLPHLMPIGQWKAIIISGLIWGVWHAPAIVREHNYPGYPILGIFMVIVFCNLVGTIFAWLYLNPKSPWIAALAHGFVNAVAGLPVLFLKPGFDMAIGGMLAAPNAWIDIGSFIIRLIRTRRLPVLDPVNNEQVVSQAA
jgi:membrane protease YdiL (CAAX protease family)